MDPGPHGGWQALPRIFDAKETSISRVPPSIVRQFRAGSAKICGWSIGEESANMPSYEFREFLLFLEGECPDVPGARWFFPDVTDACRGFDGRTGIALAGCGRYGK
jgi:hypothetical protein